MKAVPINSKGEVTAPAQSFTVEQFEKMKSCFRNPKNFPWKVVDDNYTPSEGKELMKVSTKPKETIEVVAPKIELKKEFKNKSNN